MGSYTADAEHKSYDLWIQAREGVLNKLEQHWTPEEAEVLITSDFSRGNHIDTDDFTPEQALTRLAYKVHGEII